MLAWLLQLVMLTPFHVIDALDTARRSGELEEYVHDPMFQVLTYLWIWGAPTLVVLLLVLLLRLLSQPPVGRRSVR